ncbi:hypothetical protein [Catenulispora pinisilvae]|uniref:hypothetical protein n=1 Tax=Catenulispora pinisilvae TaxID=2705253 RepID=UPI0018925052|nr:hypothetical protein [Catenulispora pinisilvae]
MGYTLDPAVVPPHTTEMAWVRFCAKTVVTTHHVIWTGALSKGYGTFHDPEFRDLDLELVSHGATVTATRWLWSAYHGPIDLDMRMMHACNLPICVRLASLEPGQQQWNIQDAANQDRLARRHGHVRVDKADVRGAELQSRTIRFAVKQAIRAGVTDPGLLDRIVQDVVAEGDPDRLSAQTPLFRLADLPAPARRAQRRRLTQPDAA